MSFKQSAAATAAALLGAIALLPSCKVREPEDPKIHIPGPQQYYNEALGFSLYYPSMLSLKVEDRGVADSPDIALRLEYPGNDHLVLSLVTHDPAMIGHVRQYLVTGSDSVQPVGGETGSRFKVENQAYDPLDARTGGPTIQHVAVERRGKLYVMTGEGDNFEKILGSFEFIDEPVVPVAE